jgi:hypothetical protein
MLAPGRTAVRVSVAQDVVALRYSKLRGRIRTFGPSVSVQLSESRLLGMLW